MRREDYNIASEVDEAKKGVISPSIPVTLRYGTPQPLHNSSRFLRRNPRHQAPRTPIPRRFTSLQSPSLLLLLQGTHVALTIVQFTQQLPPFLYLIP